MLISGSLTLVPFLEIPLFFCWLVLFIFNMMALFYHIVFYITVFCCYLLETCSFLMRDRKGLYLERQLNVKELGGREACIQ